MRNAHRLLAALAIGTGISCGGDTDGPRRDSRYGGVFNMNETEALRSIFPLTLTQASAFRIASQMYQGLVCFDPRDLSIQPCLADTWEVDRSGTRYTFHLREGVRFHDDPVFPDGQGRAVTADDVVRCFNAICQRGRGDQVFWLFQDQVEGANATYAADPRSAPPVSGIEAVDHATVRLTLTRPVPNFLQIIAHSGCWIYPQELLSAYGDDLMQHAIGTGPFRLRTARTGETIVLERNAHYWGKDREGRPLPYLDGVRVTLVQDKDQEVEQFLHGRLSMLAELSLSRVGVLADSVDAATHVRKFKVLSVPALAVQFFGLNATKPPFNDVRVRRAFAMAIDRRVLVDSVLQGLAVKADHGMVAPGLAGYPYEIVPGIPFDPDSARQLLAAAGYPDGRGFPRIQLQLNNDGFGYARVAGEVQNMLQRELHVAISVSVMPARQHYERVESGEALFWREGWIADHPDPENFLALLYGKNAVSDTSLPASLNTTRYASPLFDSLFASARRTTNEGERLHDLAMAERVAMKDIPIIPLYHERFNLLLQPWVRDLSVNAIEYLDLSMVWFDRSLMKN